MRSLNFEADFAFGDAHFYGSMLTTLYNTLTLYQWLFLRQWHSQGMLWKFNPTSISDMTFVTYLPLCHFPGLLACCHPNQNLIDLWHIHRQLPQGIGSWHGAVSLCDGQVTQRSHLTWPSVYSIIITQHTALLHAYCGHWPWIPFIIQYLWPPMQETAKAYLCI